MKKVLVFIFLLLPTIAFAQSNTQRNPCFLNSTTTNNGIANCTAVSSTNPLPVASTFSSGGISAGISNGSPSTINSPNALYTDSFMYIFDPSGGTWRAVGTAFNMSGTVGNNIPGVGAGGQYNTSFPVLATGQMAPIQVDSSARVITVGPNADSSTPIAGVQNVTSTDCSGTVTTGGTAQNAFTATSTKHGFTIANLDTTEALWISFTGTAAAATAGSYPLSAATATTFAGVGSFTSPVGFGTNKALSVVAATTGHKFSCTWW